MLANLQLLRGVAALLVVIHHIIFSFNNYTGAEYGYKITTNAFAFGVDLFFVISGFIMVHTTRTSGRTPTQFLWNRAARIIPLYWLFTALTFALASAGVALFGLRHPDFSTLLNSSFFIPEFDHGGHPVMPLLPVGWTLNFEVFFYACFSFTLLFPESTPRELLLVPLFGAITILSKYDVHRTLWYYSNTIIWEFVYGILIAFFFATPLARRLSARRGAWVVIAASALWVLLIAGLMPDVAREFPTASWQVRFLAFGVPAALIVCSILALENDGAKATSPLLLLIGAASYSIYLIHPFILQLIGKIMIVTGANESIFGLVLGYAVMVIAVIAVGTANHVILERPLTAALQKLGGAQKTAREKSLPSPG